MKNSSIALVGAHNSGKSTILNAIRDQGFLVDDRSISRTAQAKLGWGNLSRAQESEKNMWDLQDMILEAMNEREDLINKAGEHVFVARGPADLYGYTNLWVNRIGKDKVDMARVEDYLNKCKELGKKYFLTLVIPMREEITFKEEHDRADKESQGFHEEKVLEFVKLGYPHEIVRSLDNKDRVFEIFKYVLRQSSVV